MTQSSGSSTLRRRAVLGSVAAGLSGATGGCLQRLRSVTGWQSTQRVSVRIKTLPADADPYALQVARTIAEWFRAAGIDATVSPLAPEELYRQVLLNADFDAFVGRLPATVTAPDELYGLLHSRFSEEAGWQNPFGYANLEVDDGLDAQRRVTGAERRDAVAQLQQTIARTQPFLLVAVPDAIVAARTDRFEGWTGRHLSSAVGYLAVERADGDAETDEATTGTATPDALRVVTTDRRPTENLNPLAAEFRGSGVLTGLLYDSLGYQTQTGRIVPWLAESWNFSDGGDEPVATVRLRSDRTWHDGTALTADDVAFTYAMLADSTLGRAIAGTDTETDTESNAPIAAPRFRGRSSLVDGVRAVDDETVEFHFSECDPGVATRAFTVPVLPRHVWEDRTGRASVGGLTFGPATEALVTNNIPPVGSGPLEFGRNTPGETLVLERFEDHFLVRGDDDAGPPGVGGGPSFDRLSVRVVGSDETAVSMVDSGDADVTGTALGASTTPRIARSNDLDLLVARSASPYVLGYNARRPPFTNPRFRNILAQLVDRGALVSEVFDEYARPAVTPLTGTSWVPDDLEWDDGDPITPFLGSDGSVDGQSARETFRDAGYEYDDGNLVVGN